MRKNHGMVDTVFVLVIFCIFAMSVLLVLMLSGSIYGHITDVSSEGRDERIVLSYIRTKIRNTDSKGVISIIDFHGINTLSLKENLGEREFVTWIYVYDGWVRELFHEAGNFQIDFMPENGIALVRADFLNFEIIENNLLQVKTGFGSMLIYPRSEIGSDSF